MNRDDQVIEFRDETFGSNRIIKVSAKKSPSEC